MTAESAAARVMSTGAAGSSRPAAPLAATARTTRWGVAHVPDPDDHRAFHVIDGKGGNDTVVGGAGVEWVYGGAGSDTIYGRGGDDRIVAGAGTDTVHGGSGIDYVYSSDLEDRVIDDGYEMVVVPAVAVSQSGPVTGNDWVWVYGGSGVDVLRGNTQNDVLWGGPGRDTLDGQGHDDQLHGGNGTDHLDGGPDADTCTRGETTAGCETEGRR